MKRLHLYTTYLHTYPYIIIWLPVKTISEIKMNYSRHCNSLRLSMYGQIIKLLSNVRNMIYWAWWNSYQVVKPKIIRKYTQVSLSTLLKQMNVNINWMNERKYSSHTKLILHSLPTNLTLSEYLRIPTKNFSDP